MYPDQFMSSLFKLFDWTLGSSSTLRNKRITMTGANGAFGTALERELESYGVRSIKILRYGADFGNEASCAGCIDILQDTDILILAHGLRYGDVMKANYETSRRLVEMFALHRKFRRCQRPKELPEV
ncbi:hypothetical protein KCU83_g9428, partial [Aureobasidium melanogenum]